MRGTTMQVMQVIIMGTRGTTMLSPKTSMATKVLNHMLLTATKS